MAMATLGAPGALVDVASAGCGQHGHMLWPVRTEECCGSTSQQWRHGNSNSSLERRGGAWRMAWSRARALAAVPREQVAVAGVRHCLAAPCVRTSGKAVAWAGATSGACGQWPDITTTAARRWPSLGTTGVAH